MSERITVTLRDLDEAWSFQDLIDAHDVLDALEEAEALQAKQR